MGLKDWLWNDNATELFSLRKADLPHCREQAQKAVKNSIAMGSTLLFGTEESQGLLKTVSEVSSKVGRNLLDAAVDSSSESNLSSTEMEYRSGPEGDGYYMKGGSSKWYD